MKTEYQVIWNTGNVTKEQREKDLSEIRKQCKIAEKHEPFFCLFGGTVTLEDRTYQVMPTKAKGAQ